MTWPVVIHLGPVLCARPVGNCAGIEGISRWCHLLPLHKLAGLEIAGLTFLLPFPFVCASALRMFLGCCWQKTHFVFWHDCHETLHHLHGQPDNCAQELFSRLAHFSTGHNCAPCIPFGWWGKKLFLVVQVFPPCTCWLGKNKWCTFSPSNDQTIPPACAPSRCCWAIQRDVWCTFPHVGQIIGVHILSFRGQ